MERNRVQLYLLYLLWLLAGILLVGCTAEPVEEIVPEESRPVALSFGKPNLGVPELPDPCRRGYHPTSNAFTSRGNRTYRGLFHR